MSGPLYRKIAPGVYERDGEMHLDIPELLRANGYADTPENRETMIQAAEEIARQAGIPHKVED